MTPFWKKKDGHQGLAKLGRREAWQEVARQVGGPSSRADGRATTR